MSGETDQAKGRIKQAAGDLADNELDDAVDSVKKKLS